MRNNQIIAFRKNLLTDFVDLNSKIKPKQKTCRHVRDMRNMCSTAVLNDLNLKNQTVLLSAKRFEIAFRLILLMDIKTNGFITYLSCNRVIYRSKVGYYLHLT